MRSWMTGVVAALMATAVCQAADQPTRQETERALRKAVEFFANDVAPNGAFVWRYSGDLKLREGEGHATETMGWVQPPGAPTVGEAFLDAYDATGERFYLDAARTVANALLKSQLRTGGWDHHVELDPQKRQAYGYRDLPKRKKQAQKTSLDDDITPSAVRFLMRLDETLKFQDARVHEAVAFALESMLRAQYPNGAWYQWWDRYPDPPSVKEFPAIEASYPESWPRVWPNDWTGRYFLNDDVMKRMIVTLVQAWETYGERRYLEAARKAGDFLLLAQMPEPQPAWAQQYDPKMHPVWDRKFEPPAISGYESQGVMEALLLLYRVTGETKYLEPIPRALVYFRRVQFPDGQLARFYELRTDRPLYFKVTGRRYDLTYDDSQLPKHYGFKMPSRLDAIEAEYQRLIKDGPTGTSPEPSTDSTVPELAKRVRQIMDSQDDRGAWVEHGGVLDSYDMKPKSGVISCATFVENVRTLCAFLESRQ